MIGTRLNVLAALATICIAPPLGAQSAAALSIGLNHPDLFHWVLGYSAAVGGQFNPPELDKAMSAAGDLNRKLKLLWVSCGKQDFLYQANRQFVDTLQAKGVKVNYKETEGAHVWSVWRNNLNETAAMLFVSHR